jgi:5-methylthioadenosine/S-adenosylhomocysteine deaminase
MENEIGSLAPGKRADLIVIDTARPALSPDQTIVSNLVYSNDPWAVRDVFIDGEQIVADGRHQKIDAPSTIDGARLALARVLDASGLDDYMATRSSWSWQ